MGPLSEYVEYVEYVMAHHVLFLTDRGERHQRAALNAAPSDLGLNVTMLRTPSRGELAPHLPTAEIIISERNQPVTGEIIHQAPRLKLIVRLGSVWHDIDLETAHAAGVKVSAQPVAGSIYCAEHALLLMLGLCKRLMRSHHIATQADHTIAAQRTDEDTFAFNWQRLSDIGGLAGKTIAILGMGEIGVELARRLQAFRPAAMLYFKRTPYPQTLETSLGVQYAPLPVCVQRADILVSLLPYNLDTDYRLATASSALNRDRLALLKPSALVVGIGSGSVLDEQALADMLRAGQLAGVALDTYEFEPLQADHPLIELARDPTRNVLLTPHVAALHTEDGKGNQGNRASDYAEVRRFLAGEPLQHEVD